jgi:ABC-2 type transport system permease protein
MPRAGGAMPRLLRAAYYSYVGQFIWLTPKVYVLSKVVGPILQITFFSLLFGTASGRGGMAFAAIGNAVQGLCLSSIFGVAICIAGERQEGMLPYLVASPANRILVISSKAVIHVLDALVTVAVGLAFAAACLEVPIAPAQIPALVLCTLVAAASTASLGLLVGAAGLYVRDVTVPANLVTWITLIFCGVNLPVGQLPAALQPIAWMLPLTRSLEAIRRLLAGAALLDLVPLLLMDLLIGLVIATIACQAFRLAEVHARRGNRTDLV